MKELQQKFNEGIVLLEKRAIEQQWCITNDHCLRRVIYDYLYKDDWRNHCFKLPVYKQLTKEQLNLGLKLIAKLQICSSDYISLLNYASLKWRNKI